MDGEQMKKFFEQYGDEIMKMLKNKGITENSNPKEEIGNYFNEHSREITEMIIKKTFKDGIKNEEKTTTYIRKMQEKGQEIIQKAAKFKVKPYEYQNDFGELKEMQGKLICECNKNFDENVVKKAVKTEQGLDDLNITSHEFHQDSVDSCREYQKMYEEYVHKQDDALLNALNGQALLTIHTTDANNLMKELNQITNRKTIDKIKDLFSGQSKIKKERATEIKKALEIITDRIKSDQKEYEKPSIPDSKLKPEQVIANIYKAREAIEISRGSNSEYSNRFSEMIEYLKEKYDINFNKVNELILDGKNQLPQVIGKWPKITEQQRMKYFMEHQGYIDKEGKTLADNDKKSSTIQTIDSVKIWTTEKIEKIKNRISKVKEIGDRLQKEKDKNKETQIIENKVKGMGEGFNMVR